MSASRRAPAGRRQQLREAHVSAELHMYADTGHTFNLNESNRISILHWPNWLADWLADGGWLDGIVAATPWDRRATTP